MSISVDLITGFMVGLEFYSDDLFGSGMILDLGILRIVFERVTV